MNQLSIDLRPFVLVLLASLTVCLAQKTPRQEIEALLGNNEVEKAQILVSEWKKRLPEGISSDELLFCEGNVHLSSRRFEEAVRIFQGLAVRLDGHQASLLAETNAKLGRSLALTGDMKSAIAAWGAEVKTTLALKRQVLIEGKKAVYFLNRLELDGALEAWQTVYSREAPAMEEKDNLLQLNLFMLNLAEGFAGMRKLSAETAEMLLEKGLEAEALALCLRAVSTGEDRCFQRKARLRENQRQLDLVAQPPKAEEMVQLFCILGKVASKKQPDALLLELAAEELAKEYSQALSSSWKPQGEAGAALEKLASRQTSPFWRNVLKLEATLAYFREGKFERGLSCLSEPSQAIELKQHSAYLEGIILMAQGQFEKAALKLEEASQGGRTCHDAVLSSKARLLCSEAYEANGNLLQAKADLEQLLAVSTVLSHHREASMALQRLEKMQGIVWHPNAKALVSPLAENRSTHGDWPMNMGREYHLLAAQQGVTDTIGYAGPQNRMNCRFRTNNAKEKCRLWVTQAQSTDPAALWNPYGKCRTTANRDDYGEQYPIGKGPDLILDCDIPAGAHILSLYFVNDCNYYEANRAYAITLLEGGQLLASIPLRWFGGGVYKRFAVDGPRKLEVRIQRNASINVLLCGVFLDKRDGLFTEGERAGLLAFFPEEKTGYGFAAGCPVKEYGGHEKKAMVIASAKGDVNLPLHGLLKADAWIQAGQCAWGRKCLMEAVCALENERNAQIAEEILKMLCNLDYWNVGGEDELWMGEQPHPLEQLWSAWLKVRRRRVKSGDMSISSHQQEMFQLLQETDWRVVASVRKEMWEDCSGRRKGDSASWAYYAMAKQFHREHKPGEKEEFLAKALTALQGRPDARLQVRLLETRLNWQCSGEGKPIDALETYRELEKLSTVTSQQRSIWCIQLYAVYANHGEYDNALTWLEKAEKLGASKRQIDRLRESLKRRKGIDIKKQ